MFIVNVPDFFKFYIITGLRKYSNFHLKRKNSNKFFHFRIKYEAIQVIKMKMLILLSVFCLTRAQNIFDVQSLTTFFSPPQFGNFFTRMLDFFPGYYFPIGEASAIAILKGSLNGKPVQGTVIFIQKV